MSYHTRNTDSLNATLKTLMKRGAQLGLGIGAFTPIIVLANPTGGQVAAGGATIGVSGNTTTIKQSTSAAIINWQQFNIGASEYVKFLQPSTSSVILNRVVGGGLTSIYGNLTANGHVFLVNPYGVFFGKGSVLDAQGFVASTLNISDNNFMAGRYVFQKGSGAPAASIVNQGSITAHNGGYVVLAGDYAENDGIIAAPSGHVVLASGARATLGLSGNSLVNFAVNQATLAGLAGVDNAGQILADGGQVIMTADVANQLRATVVNNTGLVEAHGINKTAGGIFLTATGGGLTNSGTLDANAVTNFTQGGKVVLTTDQLLDLTSTSKITARGDGARGGSIQFHGENAKFGGSYKVGHGGTILLDPAAINFKTGATGTAMNTIGTATVKGELSSGTNVAISASTHIGHTGSATGLTAVGTGNLTLKIGSGGTIALSGFDINIGGHFITQVVGTGSLHANESFGHITAKSVGLNAGTGTVTLTGASGSLKSIKTTGPTSDGSASIVAGHLTATGDLSISAGGNLKLNASIGSSVSAGPAFGHNVTLVAGRDVNVTRSIYAGANTNGGSDHFIHITAASHANIGSASRRVTLDAGGAISVSGQKGVNMGATFSGESLKAGLDALAVNRDLTLTAASGQVVIHAKNGSASAIDHGADPNRHTINLTAGHDIVISGGTGVTIQAGNALVSAAASLSKASSTDGNISVFDNVNLLASHNIKITAASGDVNIQGGSDRAHLSNNDSNLTLNASGKVLLRAPNAIDVTASSGSININGGTATLEGGSGSFTSNTAKAIGLVALDAHTITLGAKNSVNIQGGSISLAGSGSPHALGVTHLRGDVGVYFGTSGSSSVPVSSVNIDASNGDINITGGKITSQGGGGSTGANFIENFQAGVAFNAHSGGITLQAGNNVNLHGGNSNTLTMGGSSGTGVGNANGWVGVDLTTTGGGDISVTAGSGSLTLANGVNETVSGHSSLSQFANLDAAVRVNTGHNLNLSAAGNLNVASASIGSVHSASFNVQNGNLKTGNLNATGDVFLTDEIGKLTTGNITAGGAITLKAGRLLGSSSLAASAGSGGSISAGNLQGKSVSVTALRGAVGSPSSGQLANIHVGNVTATSGGISLTADDFVGNNSFGGGHIHVAGDLQATKGAISVIAVGRGHSGGQVHITGDVTTVTSGNVTLTASHPAGNRNGGSLSVGGSINAAGNVNINASHGSAGSVGGYITLHDVTGLKINIAATNSATFSGGSVHVIGALHATGSGTGDGVTITAHDVGNSLSTGGHITVSSGGITADHGDVTLSATNDNGSNAGITIGGSISGRKVKITTSAHGSSNSRIALGFPVTAASASISAAHGGSLILAAGSSIAPTVKTTVGGIKITGGNLRTAGFGNLVLDAATGIDLAASVNSVANVDLTAHSGALSVGNIHANQHVHLKDVKGNITGSGSIVAGQGGVNVTASNGSIFMSGATLKATGSAENAVVMSATGGDLTAGAISASSQVHLTATGHTVSDDGTIKSKLGNIIVSAAALDMSGGSVNAQGSVQLTASSGNLNVHDVHATNGKVTLTDNSGDIFGSGSIVAVHNSVQVTASNGSISMGSATIKGSGESATVKLTATGGNITAGVIHATSSVTLTATGHEVTDAHLITTAGGNITVNAAAINLTSGSVDAHGSVLLTASSGSLSMGSARAHTGDVKIKDVSGNIHGGGTIGASNGNISVIASNGSIAMGGATLVASGSGHNVTMTATGGNLTAGVISASGSVSLTATGHNVQDTHKITAVGGGVTVSAANLTLSNASINAGGSVSLTASNGEAGIGTITAANGDVKIKNVSGGIFGFGNIVASNGDVSITASNGSIGMSGSITAGISASGNVTLTATGHKVTDTNHITAGSNVTVTGGSMDLGDGGIVATSVGLTVTAGDMIAGGISASHITLTGLTSHKFTDSGQINLHTGNFALTAKSMDLAGGSVHASSGNVSLTATGGDLIAGGITAAAVTLTATGHTIRDASQITASSGNVTLSATNINLHSGGAAGTKVLLTATGNLDAGRISAASSINLTHTTGDIKLASAVSGKSVTINAGAHAIIFDAASASVSSAGVLASNNVTLTANHYGNSAGGLVTLDAGLALTVKGAIGTGTAAAFRGDLALVAGGAIKLDHNVFVASGGLFVEGKSLAYTGKAKTFTMSDAEGVFALDASIGTKLAPVKYNVVLKENDEELLVQRSIFTGTTAAGLAANITLDEFNGGHFAGAYIGGNSGNAVTLSTKGTLSVTGRNAGAGAFPGSASGSFGSALGTVGAVTLNAKNISFAASGGGSSGHVFLVAGSASVGHGSDNVSLKLTATGNITLHGDQVIIRGGDATAALSSSAAKVTAHADVSLTAATGTVTLTGGASSTGGVFIEGGTALAGVFSGSGAVRSAKATADVTISAKAITVTGNNVEAFGGFADAVADAGAAQTATATANADTLLKSATNITLTAGAAPSHNAHAILAGGSDVGSGGSAVASGAKAVAKATATGNLTLSAPGTIAIKGNFVGIFGGSSAGRSADVQASGGGVAAFSALANTKVTAHTLTFGGSRVAISGGSSAAFKAGVFASAAGAATLTAQAGVSLVSATTLTITATDGIAVRGGRGAAKGRVTHSSGSSIISSGNTGSSGTTFQVFQFHSSQRVHPAQASAKGTGAKATLSATAGVSLSAPGNITLTGGAGAVSISGGNSAASVALARASNGGVATLTASAPVTITAGGALKITGAGVGIHGGARDGVGAPSSFNFAASSVCFSPGGCSFLGSSFSSQPNPLKAKGTGAQAKLSATGTVSLKGASVALTATGSAISIAGGRSDGRRASISASHGGLASVGVKDGVAITAATTFTAKGPDIGVSGGSRLGDSAFVAAIGAGAKAILNGDATVAISAKSVLLSAASSLDAHGGSSVARFAFAGASLGGSAAMTAKAGLTLKATSGTLTAHAGGDMLIAAGGTDVGQSASVDAFRNGIAKLTADDTTLLSGTAGVKLSAGGDLSILGAAGERDGASAGASASFGGKATLTDNTTLTITTPVAFTAKAGGQLSIEGANSLGFRAAAQALHRGAAANIVDTGQVNITAATVGLSASGSIGVFGGAFAASAASAYANFGGSANVSANAAVNITGKSGVTLKLLGTGSGGGIGIGGGFAAAGVSGSSHAAASADTHGGKATITGIGDVNIKATAAGAPVTITNGAHNSASIFIGAGSHVASSAFAGASFNGSAAVNASANVNITAPGTLTITAGNHGNLSIVGGSNAGAFAFDFAGSSGKAVINANATVNLTAVAGAFKATAGGDVVVAGGGGNQSFLSAATVVASGASAIADYAVHAGVNISAHTAMTLTAGGNLTVAGGGAKDAFEYAVFNGVASVNMDASVALKAITTMTISAAAGDVTVRGGDQAGILGNLFFSPSNAIPSVGGDLKGAVTVGTTISAGSNVTLKAGGDLTVMAGAGEVMNVGGLRINGGGVTIGDRWKGGTANLSGNDAVTVTAGHNLTLTAGAAGAGDLAVLGLQPNNYLLSFSPSSFITLGNLVAVRGGSSAAVAKVTFDGDATLTAKNDIVVSANGGASVIGGIVNNVRADHTRGDVTLLGSANATLKAGHDVLLKDVTGSLTVVGANANSSGQGQMLVDAHADSGTALVTGSANGLISAGHDIFNAPSHALGGDVNLEAGGLVFDVAIGAGTHQQAHTTANAGLKAGNNITLVAGGDLNVLGGLFDSASASAASASTGERIATMQAHAGITAGAAVSLTITGDGFIAAGDGLAAAVSFISVSHMKGSASADVGASIKGGTAVTLSVGGDLLVRAGGSDAARLVVVGGSDKTVANADAETVIAATSGPVNITVTGAASFLGGSGASGRDVAFGSNVSAVGNTRADVQVSAGGTGTLTVTAGSLTAAGGPNVAQAHFSSQILAVFPGAVANMDIEGGVSLTGGNVTLKATTGDLDLLGGSTAGASMQVIGAVSASADLTVNAGVKVKSLGNISLTATAGDINLAAGTAAGVFMEVIGSSGAAVATANVDAGILIDGKNVTVQTTTGDINVFGGNFAGGFMQVIGAFGASASANVNDNVRIKASAALKVASGGNLTVVAGSLASVPASSSGSRPFVLGTSGGTAHAKVNTSVKFSGGTGVTITHVGALTTNSSGTISAGNLFMDGTVDLNAPLTAAVVNPFGLSPVGGYTNPFFSGVTLTAGVNITAGSFGYGVQPLTGSSVSVSVAPASQASVVVTPSPVQVLTVPAAPLSTLQSQSLVKSLQPVIAPLTLQAPEQKMPTPGQVVSFTPATEGGSSASSIGSACLVVLVQDGAADARCLLANH